MNKKVLEIIEKAENIAEPLFKVIDGDIALYNQKKVLNAFREHRVAVRHFTQTTGYGYDDVGRDTLANVFATVFGAESAIVSPNIVSGTHALTITLFGLLRPNDTLLCITGAPYDTLKEVINGENIGSLKDFGVKYAEIGLKDGIIDLESVQNYLNTNSPKVIMITRSRGYDWRDALSIDDIAKTVDFIRKIDKKAIIMVDNCYGEFIEKLEPTQVGVDICAGSLIKNAGGGIAPTGGYVVGRKDLVEQVGYRLTAPSIGVEVGSYSGSYMPFYEGLFLAPSVVANAIKGTILASISLDLLGYEVKPAPKVMPKDVICSIKFNTAEELIAFIQGVQYSSPVDSYVTPEPWAMPGYDHEVIMAAGTFVQGASIELSADAPIKEPYVGYLQGGLTYQHFKIALTECLERIVK
ncbi:MAG: methionine gamma-lyase family protein [Clostridia bacterium]|nr:methionine gamma-lyase family protein [Clostridia bacterium]